jgi:hypothetical protein
MLFSSAGNALLALVELQWEEWRPQRWTGGGYSEPVWGCMVRWGMDPCHWEGGREGGREEEEVD